jgi:hypothetical protein
MFKLLEIVQLEISDRKLKVKLYNKMSNLSVD